MHQGCYFEWPWVTLSDLAKYSMTWSIERPLWAQLSFLYCHVTTFAICYICFTCCIWSMVFAIWQAADVQLPTLCSCGTSRWKCYYDALLCFSRTVDCVARWRSVSLLCCSTRITLSTDICFRPPSLSSSYSLSLYRWVYRLCRRHIHCLCTGEFTVFVVVIFTVFVQVSLPLFVTLVAGRLSLEKMVWISTQNNGLSVVATDVTPPPFDVQRVEGDYF